MCVLLWFIFFVFFLLLSGVGLWGPAILALRLARIISAVAEIPQVLLFVFGSLRRLWAWRPTLLCGWWWFNYFVNLLLLVIFITYFSPRVRLLMSCNEQNGWTSATHILWLFLCFSKLLKMSENGIVTFVLLVCRLCPYFLLFFLILKKLNEFMSKCSTSTGRAFSSYLTNLDYYYIIIFPHITLDIFLTPLWIVISYHDLLNISIDSSSFETKKISFPLLLS